MLEIDYRLLEKYLPTLERTTKLNPNTSSEDREAFGHFFN